ncbi:MAG: dithiol-disulfide isomerase, partial [Gammaproteobacteria bacterium]|nr:dithiol-disulfide isomerase [Gammaproteobacteria bacterium]NIT62257.1 dithiol-disulfide isomerase [Gammaproteobacteria bacterium]NIV19090.1 dithiol-disulfide isomerase [Gammaproteobacteria bacterium]NIY30837.1 dithiol-disulfide isomerase [Gammaproteobacteria bacterium]
AVHDALFRAYFVDARNIAAPDVLAEIVEGIGLSGEAAREVIATRSFKEAVDEDWMRSHQMGV